VEDIADFGLELHEMGGQFALAEKDACDSSPADRQRWLRLAYQARGTAIAGGSTFIQRNIVAERILGMPKG
jgi:alkylation response protein AidB-like acyl-CoA dehydrogenase